MTSLSRGKLFLPVSIDIRSRAKTAKAAAIEKITFSSDLTPLNFETPETILVSIFSVWFVLIFMCPLGGTH